MMNWTNTDQYLIGQTNNFEYKNNMLAIFDLDNTLIKTKSGKKFPINENDWEFLYDNVLSKMKKISNSYDVYIISNQKGLKTEEQIKKFIKKINDIVKQLDIDIMVYISLKNDIYRKPIPTFFNIIIKNYDIEKKNCYYCGDACGRTNDFSDTDYKFAKNCNIKMKTPEELFLNKKVKLPPIQYPNIYTIASKSLFFPKNKEMIIMVGYPASGKSSYSKNLKKLFNYEIINQDELKTLQKCIKQTELFITQNKSIIIDRTNLDIKSRKVWIDIAKKYNYYSRIIFMSTSKELSMHNNYYRSFTSNVPLIPIIAFRKLEKPSLNENVDDIITISFSTNKSDLFYYKYLY